MGSNITMLSVTVKLVKISLTTEQLFGTWGIKSSECQAPRDPVVQMQACPRPLGRRNLQRGPGLHALSFQS